MNKFNSNLRFPSYSGWLSRCFTQFLASALVLVCMATATHAEDTAEALKKAGISLEPVLVRHLTGKCKVDGVLDEPFWQNAARYEIERETYPAALAPSPVRTEVFFARLEDFIVLGFRAYDSEPDKIQAPLRDRDGIERDDYVGVSMDLAGKMLTTYEFYVSASGIQADWVRNRVDGSRARDWDANWDSAAVRDDSGYTVEMRIPLDEMEIPVGGRKLKRLIGFKRHYPRKIRRHLGRLIIVSPMENALRPEQRVKLIPSVTFLNEWSRNPVKDNGWDHEDDSSLSLDIEQKLTPSLGLFAALNPNYLEIEADLTETSINDPFTRLVPEKRPFFTRGMETFGTLYDLIYTRNIEDPRAGLKIVGSVGDVTMGNFIADDRKLRLIVPGNLSSKAVTMKDLDSASAAVRHRYDFARGLSAGVIGTFRTGQSDYRNHVGGVDLYLKPNPRHEFRTQWMISDSRYPDEITDKLCDSDDCTDPESDSGIPGETGYSEKVLRADPNEDYSDTAWGFKYKYNRRFGYLLTQYRDMGDEFRADLGYIPRVDYRMAALGGGLDHYFNSRDGGKSRVRISGTLMRQESQAGELLVDSRDVWLNYWGLLQSWVRVGYRNRDRVAKRYLQNTLVIEDNAPEFNEEQFEIRIDTTPLRNGRVTFAGKFGDQIDTDNYRLGEILELKPAFIWSLSDRIEISLEDTYRQLDVDDGRLFTENYLRLNLTYQFRRSSFMRLTVVDDWIRRDPELYLYDEESKLERDTSAELLFVWKPTQHNTFLIGFKTEAKDEDELDNPRVDDMAFYVKYGRAFRL